MLIVSWHRDAKWPRFLYSINTCQMLDKGIQQNRSYLQLNSRLHSNTAHSSFLKLQKRSLKLVSAIFIKFLVFHQMIALQKITEKCFLFYLKSPFRSRDIQIFVFFSFPFHIFQTQKNKWKWNNL